jgi:hypothetical protein
MLMVKMLGKDFVPIGLHLLGGLQFVLVAKLSFLRESEDIAIADVTCVIGNVFDNKGAIATFLTVRARSDVIANFHRCGGQNTYEWLLSQLTWRPP